MFEGKRTVFWDVTPCILLDGYVSYEPAASFFCPEYGSNTFSRNVYKHVKIDGVTSQQDLTLIQPEEGVDWKIHCRRS